MSHIATVDVEITNLDDLDAACKRIGLELVRGETKFNWFGNYDDDEERSVIGHQLPVGFTAEDLGKCDHMIRVAGEGLDSSLYEIGVCKRRDGKAGFTLVWDPYCPTLLKSVGGRAMPKLKQAYAICAARRVAQMQGFRLQEQVTANGGVRMILTK